MKCFRDGVAVLTVLAVAAVAAPATASPSEILPGVYEYAMEHGRAICRELQSYESDRKGYIAASLIIGVDLLDVPGVDSYSDPNEVTQVIDLAIYTYCPSLRR